ncbi:MAG: acylphosphatase [Verrucomicrobia bacterium]|nr:acylphosphatase [Verrucomicrobiota bacterium]MBU6446242.1 acylphosphatase [Verrucomicrobiota bacterium]MDE3047166.1 acylphosphatase [Verrucomicrobiota bacterium]
MQEIRIIVSGVVQGVGFRAIVKRHALLHNIQGFVRNLPDGRVEICAQGKGEQIQQFVHTVQSMPGAAKISNIETKYQPMREVYHTFVVR